MNHTTLLREARGQKVDQRDATLTTEFGLEKSPEDGRGTVGERD
jgi:hypothetical protein